MRKIAVLATLLKVVGGLALAQGSPVPITNADVINMTKSGIGEQTIVLAIQRGPDRFDTSPQALVEMKKEGVTDQVLNAMLAAQPAGITTATTKQPTLSGGALLQKALSSFGPREKLTSVHAIRLKASVLQTSAGKTNSSELERVVIYPDRLYQSLEHSTGLTERMVFTPEFSYRDSGKMVSEVPDPTLKAYREQIRFETPYIAQHIEDYTATYQGTEQVGGTSADILKISSDGAQYLWKIDSQTGRLLSSSHEAPSGEVVTDYSDYRLVDGLYVAFKRHTTEAGRTIETTLKELTTNPAIDENLFQRPNQIAAPGLRLKVLQSESVPYTEKIGGGVSTSCQIMGSGTTSATANTMGNMTFGSATSNSNVRMDCGTQDTTIRWPHVLNTMLVEGSDGNAYIIACDRAWRWSKCVPLRAGDTFNGIQTDKGIQVQAFNTKGKESEPTYMVLQSKALR